MFTGIIEAVGRVASVTERASGRRLRVTCPFAAELRVDESVAVNGVCLTVVAQDAESFEAVAVEETLAKTSLGDLQKEDNVNLERALVLGARLDGHLVQGHVDATGTVEAVEALEGSHLVRVAYPEAFAPYLIPAGSVTLDGISLTVARLDEPPGTLAVAIIPHTWAHTTVRDWRPGRRVNLEFDLLGKYAVRALARQRG
ncbi:MAG TPA: riboflavin synthase [Rubricoccaceae bacterium]|nr:riboflavin synthase [Rubricoccaceae bacterium]